MRTALRLVAVFAVGMGSVLGDISTSALEIMAGSLTAVILDDGSCIGNACGSISDVTGFPGWATGSIDGWSIDVFTGASRFEALAGTCGPAPDTYYGLWPGVEGYPPPFPVGWTGGCTTDTLHVAFSATDVMEQPTGLSEIPAIGLSVSGIGSSPGSFNGYVDAGDSLFSESSLVGTTGPYLGMIGHEPDGTSWFFTGGPPTSYSATIAGEFDSPGWFSTAGVVATPEPGAIVLLGTALALCASRLRPRHLLNNTCATSPQRAAYAICSSSNRCRPPRLCALPIRGADAQSTKRASVGGETERFPLKGA